VFHSEDHPNITLVPYALEFLRNNLDIGDIHRTQRLNLFAWKTAALQVNNRVNETSDITIQLKIASEAPNIIIQILAFLQYGGSSFVKTLN
jgi:hypothetical protein